MTKHLEVKVTLGEQSWTLDFATLTVDDYIDVKKVTGYRSYQWMDEFDRFDALALKAVVWVVRRRAGDDVPWDDPSMTFPMADLRIKILRDDTAPAGEPGQEAEQAVPTKAPARAPRTRDRTSRKK